MIIKGALLRELQGKTIRKAYATKHEASDSCAFGIFELYFTDGSQFSLKILSTPAIEGVLFKDAKDDNPLEADLIRP